METNKKMLAVLVAVVGLAVLAQTAGATEVTLNRESDAMIQLTQTGTATSPNTGIMRVGPLVINPTRYWYQRSLMSFGLADLLASGYSTTQSTVESITLKINASAAGSSATTIYGILQDWDLGTNTGTEIWAATENHGAALASITTPTTGWYTITLDGGVDLTALVNSWIAGTGKGLALIGDEPAVPSSSNHTTYAQTEQLIVNYSAVPEPATMAMLGLGGVMMLVRRRRNAA